MEEVPVKKFTVLLVGDGDYDLEKLRVDLNFQIKDAAPTIIIANAETSQEEWENTDRIVIALDDKKPDLEMRVQELYTEVFNRADFEKIVFVVGKESVEEVGEFARPFGCPVIPREALQGIKPDIKEVSELKKNIRAASRAKRSDRVSKDAKKSPERNVELAWVAFLSRIHDIKLENQILRFGLDQLIKTTPTSEQIIDFLLEHDVGAVLGQSPTKIRTAPEEFRAALNETGLIDALLKIGHRAHELEALKTDLIAFTPSKEMRSTKRARSKAFVARKTDGDKENKPQSKAASTGGLAAAIKPSVPVFENPQKMSVNEVKERIGKINNSALREKFLAKEIPDSLLSIKKEALDKIARDINIILEAENPDFNRYTSVVELGTKSAGQFFRLKRAEFNQFCGIVEAKKTSKPQRISGDWSEALGGVKSVTTGMESLSKPESEFHSILGGLQYDTFIDALYAVDDFSWRMEITSNFNTAFQKQALRDFVTRFSDSLIPGSKNEPLSKLSYEQYRSLVTKVFADPNNKSALIFPADVFLKVSKASYESVFSRTERDALIATKEDRHSAKEKFENSLLRKLFENSLNYIIDAPGLTLKNLDFLYKLNELLNRTTPDYGAYVDILNALKVEGKNNELFRLTREQFDIAVFTGRAQFERIMQFAKTDALMDTYHALCEEFQKIALLSPAEREQYLTAESVIYRLIAEYEKEISPADLLPVTRFPLEWREKNLTPTKKSVEEKNQSKSLPPVEQAIENKKRKQDLINLLNTITDSDTRAILLARFEGKTTLQLRLLHEKEEIIKDLIELLNGNRRNKLSDYNTALIDARSDELTKLFKLTSKEFSKDDVEAVISSNVGIAVSGAAEVSKSEPAGTGTLRGRSPAQPEIKTASESLSPTEGFFENLINRAMGFLRSLNLFGSTSTRNVESKKDSEKMVEMQTFAEPYHSTHEPHISAPLPKHPTRQPVISPPIAPRPDAAPNRTNEEKLSGIQNTTLRTAMLAVLKDKKIQISGDVTTAVDKINALARELAHELAVTKIDDLYKRFLEIVEPITGINEVKPEFIVAMVVMEKKFPSHDFSTEMMALKTKTHTSDELGRLIHALETELAKVKKYIEHLVQAQQSKYFHHDVSVQNLLHAELGKMNTLKHQLEENISNVRAVMNAQKDVAEKAAPVAGITISMPTAPKDLTTEPFEKIIVYHPDEKMPSRKFEEISAAHVRKEHLLEHHMKVRANSISYSPKADKPLGEDKKAELIDKMLEEAFKMCKSPADRKNLIFNGSAEMVARAKERLAIKLKAESAIESASFEKAAKPESHPGLKRKREE